MTRAALAVLLGCSLSVAGGAAWFGSRTEPRAASPAFEPKPAAAAPSESARSMALASGSRADPLFPDRPVTLAASAQADAGAGGAASAVGNWVTARPAYQYSHSAAERGGVEPCNTQSAAGDTFADWVPLALGKFAAPRTLALDACGHFDLVIHLHGDAPIRRELVLSGQPFVLYSLTLDLNQGYGSRFTSAPLFESIVAGIEQSLSKREGKPVHAGHIAMSAWSAGFSGVEAVLTLPAMSRVDAVVLIDGLHATRSDRESFKAQLKPFVDYAARAAAGNGFFYISHSSIDPPDFASTTECAHYLIASLGGTPESVRRSDAFGLELVESFSRGNFHVRGYAGNDKADHCAQLATLRDVFVALGRRWHQTDQGPH